MVGHLLGHFAVKEYFILLLFVIAIIQCTCLSSSENWSPTNPPFLEPEKNQKFRYRVEHIVYINI